MNKCFKSIQKMMSLIMIFALLSGQFGCVNSKIITTSQLPSYYPKYLYKIHCKHRVYELENISFANDTLSAKINDEGPMQTKHIIHIYPSSETLIQINKARILRMPLEGIKEIKCTDAAPGKSAALGVAVAGGIAVGAIIIAILNMDWDIMDIDIAW
jgi:hypothetical protein